MDRKERLSRVLKWIGLVGIILITNQVQESVQVETMDKMKTVKDKILRNYDRTIRPTNGTNTTDVYFPFFVPRQILELDEERSLLSLDSFVLMHWYDSRLEWNTSDFDGYLQLPRDLVWIPDFSVYNSHSAQVDPTNEVLLFLHSSGTVTWLPPILTQTLCAPNSTIPYPNDEFECTINMGSWTHDGWEINFMDLKLEFDQFKNTHPRWEIIQSKSYAQRLENYYDCCPEPYISLQVYLYLKRRPPPEIEATRVPCILTMVLTLSIYWLPSDSSKKIILGGFLFLVLNALLIYVAWSTKQPIAVLSGVSFLRSTMYILVMTILVEVFVINKISSLRGPSRPPSMIIHHLTGSAGKYLFLSSPSEDDQIQLTSGGEVLTPGEEWKMFASALDRVFFLITLLVMTVVHHL